MKRVWLFRIIAILMGILLTYILTTRIIDSVALLLNPSTKYYVLPILAILLDTVIFVSAGAAIVLIFLTTGDLVEKNKLNQKYVSEHEIEINQLKAKIKELEAKIENKDYVAEVIKTSNNSSIDEETTQTYNDLTFKNFEKEAKNLIGESLRPEMRVVLLCDVYQGDELLKIRGSVGSLYGFNDSEADVVFIGDRKKKSTIHLPLSILRID